MVHWAWLDGPDGYTPACGASKHRGGSVYHHKSQLVTCDKCLEILKARDILDDINAALDPRSVSR